ncbi:chitinase [Mycena galericulata]|nr:chitinase [Mycena galericulata]
MGLDVPFLPIRRDTNTTGTGTADSEGVVAAGWFPVSGSATPANVSWGMYSHLAYAFATTTPDAGNITVDAAGLRDFVQTARANNVSPLLSIGGWTGSQYFSSAVATSDNRTKFVGAITELVDTYNLDGIDFDWEYPGRQGIGCNVVSSSDSANFLLLLKQLSASSNGTFLLTAAVGLAPFVGTDGSALADVSAFADVLDRIELMVYDTWGVLKTAGPNAPLDSACEPTEYRASSGSAAGAVAAWTQAKFPADKIVLGLAAYGHSFNVTPAAALNSSTGSLNPYPALGGPQPAGPSDTPAADATPDQCGSPGTVSGVYTFAQLVSSGFLGTDGAAGDGIHYTIEGCSQTPYVYNEDTHVLISYDDAKSFASKGAFISAQGLAGFAVWEVTGDYDDILLDSLYSAMGIQDCA